MMLARSPSSPLTRWERLISPTGMHFPFSISPTLFVKQRKHWVECLHVVPWKKKDNASLFPLDVSTFINIVPRSK